jgi:hypothetical protein
LLAVEKVVEVNENQTEQVQPQAEPVVKNSLVRDFKNKRPMNKQKYLFLLLVLAVVGAGALSGYFLSTTQAFGGKSSGMVMTKSGSDQSSGQSQVEVTDEDAFPDTAEGTLVKGGIEGEGTHHLDRDMGPDKYVYLTSSVIDLDNFEGKKVQVWGQTLSGKSAGWLMDVGKVKVIE